MQITAKKDRIKCRFEWSLALSPGICVADANLQWKMQKNRIERSARRREEEVAVNDRARGDRHGVYSHTAAEWWNRGRVLIRLR